MREEDFPCLGEPERPITEDLCRNAGARYASVFSTAEDMVKAALEVKKLNRDVWVKLPFCVTIEAEAFGEAAPVEEQPILSGDLSQILLDGLSGLEFQGVVLGVCVGIIREDADRHHYEKSGHSYR